MPLVVRCKFEMALHIVGFALALDAERFLTFSDAICTLMIMPTVSAYHQLAVPNSVVSTALITHLLHFSLDRVHVLLWL